MGSSESAYYDDVTDYRNICKLMNVTPRSAELDYDHFEELKKLPCVYWECGNYKVDKENYPEYFL